MEAKKRIRSGRFDDLPEEKPQENKFFVKLIVCALFICAVMLIKDLKLPSGMTVSQFTVEYIEANTKIYKFADRLKDATVPVFGDNIKEYVPDYGE